MLQSEVGAHEQVIGFVRVTWPHGEANPNSWHFALAPLWWRCRPGLGDPLNPLTHHEILGLVGPFTRRGRHVDLAATDRLERRVAFKSIDHAQSSDAVKLRETLALTDLGLGVYRLIRLLTPEVGPDALLEAVGTEPAELLARIEAVPPQRQFRVQQGVVIAMSFRLEPRLGTDAVGMAFTRGRAQVAGLDFEVDATMVKRGPAAVALTRMPGDELQLPQDALAVLGGRWTRLRDSGQGWAGELRLPGTEPRRTRQAQAAIEMAALHLARMLAEPPRRFHERWMAARWRVFCRRLVPLAVCIGLILCAAATPKLHLSESSGLRMLILNSPPILMMLFFCMREIPVVEIPPLPRPSEAPSWRAGRPARSSTEPHSGSND